MAIAFDAATAGGNTTGTSLTFAHSCTGSNLILFVGVTGTTAGSTNITGVTYNGVSMTKLPNCDNQGSGRWMHLFYLLNPSTGSNNVIISSSPSDFILGIASSYTGVPGGIDGSNKNTAASGTSQSATVTTTINNDWLIAYCEMNVGTVVAGSGTTLRAADPTFADRAIVDSNGTVSIGSNSLNTTNSGNPAWGMGIAAFAPVVKNQSGFFLFFRP